MKDELVVVVPASVPDHADALFGDWLAQHSLDEDDPRLDAVVVDIIRSAEKRTLRQYRVPKRLLDQLGSEHG